MMFLAANYKRGVLWRTVDTVSMEKPIGKTKTQTGRVVNPRPYTLARHCLQNFVGDAGHLRHFGYIVNAHDMRACQNTCCYRGCCAPDSFFGRLAIERFSEKSFSRCAD